MVQSNSEGILLPIPVLLLKTQSVPDDAYEELFNSEAHNPNAMDMLFRPYFVPVLEHKQDTETLSQLGRMLEDGSLRQRYGGMIFTSQRAVEGWAETVTNIEKHTSGLPTSDPVTKFVPFPWYSVGPATSRNLNALCNSSALRTLNPQVLGEHTGNGANLAEFILQDYNARHAQTWFDYFEAPRLPFIPLLGMSSENYARKRLERDDARLAKKPLLFLVGEKRRDVIPKTLTTTEAAQRIEVDEVEVYRTDVMDSFGRDLDGLVDQLDQTVAENKLSHIRVVVVFSPQGCDVLLRAIGFLDETTGLAQPGWDAQKTTRYVVATIGPTTRDYLRDQFAFEAHVCASKPSPQALKHGILEFLKSER